MAFKTPTFNLWCQVWRPDGMGNYDSMGYSPCAVRGPDSHGDSGLNTPPQQVLFPKGSDIRPAFMNAAGLADIIDVAGWGADIYFSVTWVEDKGAGYSNEYRIAGGSWQRWAPGDAIPPRPVNPALTPPLGYDELPIVSPAVTWPDRS